MKLNDLIGRSPCQPVPCCPEQNNEPQILPEQEPSALCIVAVWQAFVDPLKVGVLVCLEIKRCPGVNRARKNVAQQ